MKISKTVRGTFSDGVQDKILMGKYSSENPECAVGFHAMGARHAKAEGYGKDWGDASLFWEWHADGLGW